MLKRFTRFLGASFFVVLSPFSVSCRCMAYHYLRLHKKGWALLFCPSGVYLHDSQIKEPSKSAQDMEMAAELWAETEKQLAEAEKKLNLWA
jgi:hypothetical protein